MKTDARQAAGGKFVITLLVGALIVMVLPIINGGAIIFFDTPSYLEQATKVAGVLFPTDSSIDVAASLQEQGSAFGSPQSDNVVTSGRSLYYGLFMYAGWITSLWVPIAIQALVLSWLVLLLFKLASPQAWPYKAIATLCVISIFSSASFFAGLLMPDIWVGIMILTLAVLWTYDQHLSIWSRLTMLAILAFSVLVHASHFVVLAAVTFFLAILWFINPDRDQPFIRKFAIPVLALALGVAGMAAYSFAVKVGYGAKLLHRPFITAHLTDMGPGTAYLQQSCPESGFVLCDYKDRLPIDWRDFLFDESPEKGVFGAVPVETQLALADEQVAFVLQTLAADPVSTIFGFMRDGWRQLWTLSINDVPMTVAEEAFLVANSPPGLAEWIKQTRAYNSPDLTLAIERNIAIFAVLSSLIVVAWLILRTRRSASTDPETAAMDSLIAVLIAGVVLNAVICGMLASPFGRFQARIVWILPLAASLILASKLVALEKPRWLPKLGRS